MAHDPNEERIRSYLRRLENPYASLQIRDVADETPATSAPAAEASITTRRTRTQAPTQDDLFTDRPQIQGLIDPPSGNPYAALANIDDDEVASSVPTAQGEISKSAYETGCRRIFTQYIPAVERGQLRPEYRDFITRTISRSARVRFKLLEALGRFDLSDIVGLQAQFNREPAQFTAKKLAEIERDVGADD